AGAVQANRTLSTLSAMFAWGMRAGLAKENPAALVPKNAESPRDRVLSDHEVRTIWKATSGLSDFNRIVRLLLLTGCRRQEVGGMRWSEVEGNLVTVSPNRTKTAVPHEIPLSEAALQFLPHRIDGRDCVFGQPDLGFSGWSREKRR